MVVLTPPCIEQHSYLQGEGGSFENKPGESLCQKAKTWPGPERFWTDWATIRLYTTKVLGVVFENYNV